MKIDSTTIDVNAFIESLIVGMNPPREKEDDQIGSSTDVNAFIGSSGQLSSSSASPMDSCDYFMSSPEGNIRAPEIPFMVASPDLELPVGKLLEECFSSDQSTQMPISFSDQLVCVADIETYKEQFAETLLQLIREEIFEFGMENEADGFVQESLRNNPVFTKQWLNQVLLKHFDDVGVVTGILRILAHLEYEEIYPTGPTMALSVLSHESAEARECGIRAFENWDNTDALEYLKHIKCKEKWLQDYLEGVISDLEESHVSFCQKN